MHLSPLSETLSQHENAGPAGPAGIGRAHREGLIRGLVFLAAIALPLTLAIATGHAGPRDASAGYAQSFELPR